MTDTERQSDRGDGRVESLSLDEALSVLGEETRATILVELGRARRDDGTPEALGFSALMDRVGVEDSGLFNYHLDKLVGKFVAKDEGGYRLRLPGQRVYQAVVAGTLTERRRVEPVRVGECPDCGGPLVASYREDHLLRVACEGCERLFDAAHLPVRGVEGRDEGDLLDAAYQRRHHKLGTMRRGVCPDCGGAVARGLRREIGGSDGGCDGLDAFAVLTCEGCHASLVGHPANVALTTPAVVGFLAEHDRDAATARWWRDPVATAREETVVDDALRTAEVPFEAGNERLAVTLNDDLQVAETFTV